MCYRPAALEACPHRGLMFSSRGGYQRPQSHGAVDDIATVSSRVYKSAKVDSKRARIVTSTLASVMANSTAKTAIHRTWVGQYKERRIGRSRACRWPGPRLNVVHGGIRVDKPSYHKRVHGGGGGGHHADRSRCRSTLAIAPRTPGDQFDGSRRDRASAPCNGRSNADAPADGWPLLSQIVAIAFRSRSCADRRSREAS
jgi:hypothetical protein